MNDLSFGLTKIFVTDGITNKGACRSVEGLTKEKKLELANLLLQDVIDDFYFLTNKYEDAKESGYNFSIEQESFFENLYDDISDLEVDKNDLINSFDPIIEKIEDYNNNNEDEE